MKEKSNINYFIWVVIVLIIVVGAWMIFEGKFFGEKELTPYTIYNGYVIYEIEDEKSLRYNVQVYANEGREYIHIFKNYPEDLLELDVENDLRNILYKDEVNNLRKDKIYFSYDPNLDGLSLLSAGTLVQILGTGNAGIFKIPVVISVIEDNGNEDFPIINCDDSNNNIGVILLKLGEPKIYKDKSYDNCIVIQGNNKDELGKLMDYISYDLLGVIE